MEINMSDIMLHISDNLDKKQRSQFETEMRDQTGVIALGYHESRPHLMIVEYNRDTTNSQNLLYAAKDHGLSAKLVGML